MKKGICQGAFPPSISTTECIEIAATQGFQAIELVLEGPKWLNSEVLGDNQLVKEIAKSVGMGNTRSEALTPETPNVKLEKFHDRAEEMGITISSISGMLHWFYRFTSNKKKHVNRALEIGKRLIEEAAILGADTVLIVPGLVTRNCSYKEAYRRAGENIAKLIPVAEEFEINLALENVWNRFLLSPLEMNTFINSFHSEYVGVYFDVGNILEYGFPSDWISVLGLKIKKVHLKDYKRSIGNINGFTHLLQGDVPWDRVMSSLKSVGYDDYLIVEVPPYPSGPPDKSVAAASDSLDFLISGGTSGIGKNNAGES